MFLPLRHAQRAGMSIQKRRLTLWIFKATVTAKDESMEAIIIWPLGRGYKAYISKKGSDLFFDIFKDGKPLRKLVYEAKLPNPCDYRPPFGTDLSRAVCWAKNIVQL